MFGDVGLACKKAHGKNKIHKHLFSGVLSALIQVEVGTLLA
jgi:hypothetical protein